MFQSNIVNSLIKGLDPIQQKTVELKAGQIFNGKILKLYPGQLASLQLGGLKLTAKLEAALTAGNRYWLQVQPSEGIPVLKVIEGSNHSQGNNSNENVLRQLGLANSKTNDKIIQHFAKQQIPFSSNHIASGTETLSAVGQINERGLATLQLLIERNLPITPTAFLAVQKVMDGEGLARPLNELTQMLRLLDHKQPELQQLQQRLDAIVNSSVVKVDEHLLLQQLRQYFQAEQGTKPFLQAEQTLRLLGINNEETNRGELIQKFSAAVNRTDGELLRQIWPSLSKNEIIQLVDQGKMSELFSKVYLGNEQKSQSVLGQLISLFNENSKSEQINLQPIFSVESTPLPKQLGSILSQLGFQYERDVGDFIQQRVPNEKVVNQLKALLLNIQELQVPKGIKDKANSLLLRITGSQLLSSNQEGPIQNFAVVIPIKLFEQSNDLTIQWEGKKQEDGSLDPAHCRILFYIELATLKETVVDVQIQNRIVSLQIFNESKRPNELINVFSPFLSEALQQLNYKLLSLKWVNPKQVSSPALKRNVQQQAYYQGRPYQGVDIRI